MIPARIRTRTTATWMHELDTGGDMLPVVDEADHRHDYSTGHEDDVACIEDHVGNKRPDEGDDDRHTAQQRRDPVVDLPSAGVVDDAGPDGQEHHRRRQEGRG